MDHMLLVVFLLYFRVYAVLSFDGIESSRRQNRFASSSLGMAKSGVEIPEAVAAEINAYLMARPIDETSPREYSVMEQIGLREEIAGPENDIVPELKQTGWFRDPREEDEKRRFDKTTPMVSHPLSFRELEKYGYGHLVKPILELGGPYVVGEAIGYNWIEPTFEVDESKRPERKESFAMDIDADLSVGGSLDDKLEKAAELDLGRLKKQIEDRKKGGESNDFYVPPPSSMPRDELMDYASIKKPYSPSLSSSQAREPSVLSKLFNKPNIVAVSLAASFAFGRCTQEITNLYRLDGVVVTAVQLALIGIAFVTVLSGLNKEESTPPPSHMSGT